jgi:transcriptional regulator with XRE-family HTH domain
MSYNLTNLQGLIDSQEFKEYYEKEGKRTINLWEKIYARRKDLALTQAKLWELASIPQNKISQLESSTYWEPWFDILFKLSNALQVPFEYLSDSVDRKTIELYNYYLSVFKKVPDIMQFMKIPYFIDLEAVNKLWKKLTNFEYIRWEYWPFDKKVYDYQKLFSCKNEKWFDDIKYIYLTEEDRELIDEVLTKIMKYSWDRLKKMSYETEPLKRLWVKLWDGKYMGEVLKLG